MRGSIEAGNRSDGGAVFTITLPLPQTGREEAIA
jgi:signal transduction histidine kinase